MKSTSVHELAKKLNEVMVQDTRNNGSTFYKIEEGKEETWMVEIIRTTHGDDLPDDTIYEFIYKASEALSEVDTQGIDSDEYEEAIHQIEPEIYTHNLTEWLHRRVDHVFYMSEALENLGPFKDGFALLQAAHQEQVEEVGMALLEALREYIREDETENPTPKLLRVEIHKDGKQVVDVLNDLEVVEWFHNTHSFSMGWALANEGYSLVYIYEEEKQDVEADPN